MKKKIIIIVLIVIIFISAIFFIINRSKKKKEKVPKNFIQKIGNYGCKFSYGKICFGIPDDYQCVGNNKCQLSNEKDMLLVQVFLEENYTDSLDSFIKSGKNNIPKKLVDVQEVDINKNRWITAKSMFLSEKYYFIKIENDVYSIKLLAKKDSGNKFEELVKALEEGLKINNIK